jgi:hypothetical protein
MALTFEVNDDNSVTILNDGSIFSHQTDDPEVGGWEPFKSKARAEEWAELAIIRYEEEMNAEKEASEAALAAFEASKSLEEGAAKLDGVEAEAAADSE